MRKMYSRLSQYFENEILCVSPKFGQPEGMACRPERFAKSYLALDDRLCAPPTQALLDTEDESIFIEWTYTIDLDRELFGVDKSVYFKLSSLPHHPNWCEYLTIDRRGRRVLRRNIPAELLGDGVPAIEVDGRLRDRYASFELVHEFPKILDKFETASASREAILAEAILATCRQYLVLIDRSYMEWTFSSFPFQEIAFAILSTAAGEVTFMSPQDLNNSFEQEGFLLIPNDEGSDGQQTLLPKFLHECHSPGAAPGAAPRSNPFWLGNVLVYTTPRTTLVEVEEAAVATVVDNGLNQGLTTFHAVAFSILEFVLINVSKGEDGAIRVTRSPLVNLIYFDDETSRFPHGPRLRKAKPPRSPDTTEGEQQEEEEEQAEDSFPGIFQRCGGPDKGFGPQRRDGLRAARMLISFFDATTDQSLDNSKSSVLPNEILTKIMEFTDVQTCLSFSRASGCCRNHYYRNFRLNDDYAIVSKGSGSLPKDSFILEELSSGRRITSSLEVEINKDEDRSFKPKKTEPRISLNAIVGMTDPGRRVIMDEWRLTFSNISPSRPPYPGERDMPNQ